MSFLGDVFGGGGGDEAAKAAIKASETTAEAQREALEYLKEREAIPQQFREGALTELGGLYGLEGGTGSQEAIIQRAIKSPLYQNIMGGREAGEEAILRNLAATGGLRSGTAQEGLYDYNTQLQNKALLESYNQQLMGLQGLGSLPSMAPVIAGQISGIGQTLGQGQIAAAQARQAGSQQGMGNLMGFGGLAIDAYSSGMFSDRRLKKNIKVVGKVNGFNWYSFDWNSVAEKFGLSGSTFGIMADEVFDKAPGAVMLKDGALFVLYGALGIFPEIKEA